MSVPFQIVSPAVKMMGMQKLFSILPEGPLEEAKKMNEECGFQRRSMT